MLAVYTRLILSSNCFQKLRGSSIDALMNGHWTAPPHPHTWAWHGHNGGHMEHLGLVPPGTLDIYTQQMARAGLWWRVQLRNPNLRLSVRVCAAPKADTIGTRLSSAILPSSLFSPDDLLRRCICVPAYVWVCHGWCPFIVTAQQGLKAQKWLRESLRLLSL